MSEKQKEIDTIKPRKYTLNLSDADIQRLAEKAGQYNMTTSELLENFIADLVDGTYSNGSDERMIANEWAERCYFSLDHEKNFITFLSECYVYSIEDFMNKIDRINELKNDIELTEKEIAQAGSEWDKIVHRKYDADGNFIEVPAYESVEEYISCKKVEIEDLKNDIAYEEEKLEEIRESFNEYMGNKSYVWEDEVKAFMEWYRKSIPEETK